MTFRITHIANPPILCVFFLLSLIPAGSFGSVYELIILPSIFLLSFISLAQLTFSSKILFPASITIIALSLAIINTTNTSDFGPIFVTILRIYSLLFLLSLLNSRLPLRNSHDYLVKTTKSHYLIPCFVLVIVLLSLLKAISSSYFNGIDYPFYTQESVNRQLFGPSIMLTGSYLFFLSFKLLSPCFASISITYKLFVFTSAFTAFFAGLLSGSRFPFLILLLSLILLAYNLLTSTYYLTQIRLFYKTLLRPRNFFLLLLFGFFIIYNIGISLFKLVSSIESSERVFSRILRLQSIILDPASDPSRGSKLINNFQLIENFYSNLFGNSLPSFQLDSTLVTFGSYFGFVFIICLLFYIMYLSLKTPMLLLFSCSTAIFILIGGLVFLSPRFYLLPFAVISLINHFTAVSISPHDNYR